MNESKKLVPNSVMLARNEAEDIIGAIKESLFFAEDVWVIIDLESSDDTERVIKTTFKTKRVHVEYQIKDLAKIRTIDPSIDGEMQDESCKTHLHDGNGRLFMHWNITHFVNQIVKPGEWWHWISPDERFAPKDYHEVWFWVRYAQQFGYEAVYSDDHLFIKDEVTGSKFDWCIKFTHPGTPHHFLKMLPGGWKKGLGAHTGCTLPADTRKRLKMPVNHYHFAYVKDTRIPFKGPRDHAEYQFHPRYQFYNPMGEDWRMLPDVDTKGNLVPPCDVELDKVRQYEGRVAEIQQASSAAMSLRVQLDEKQNLLKTLENDITAAKDKQKLVQVEFARIERVKKWRTDDIAELEKQINEVEKKL